MPVALLNLSGKYTWGKAALSWQLPNQDVPDTVYIYPISGTGAARRANAAYVRECPLHDAPSGLSFEPQAMSAHDVAQAEYLVFLGPSNEPSPNLEGLLSNPEFTVSVIVGSATVFYEIITKKTEEGFDKHIITLQSNFSIARGILGYSFQAGGQRFAAAFPGEIKRGKQKYPPFFTRTDANVRVEVVGGKNSDISTVEKRLTRLPFCK
jgi:hypothetical protein